MNVLDVIDRLLNTSVGSADLKYCLVDDCKRPFKTDNNPARPNINEDFVSIEELLQCNDVSRYAGVGISIQASQVCAIDIDNCFSVANDVDSADERAKDVLSLFEDCAYCEFSFSGHGLRILFRQPVIKDYSQKYYIKNAAYHVEYYQPSKSFRYVTLTGNVIADNGLDNALVKDRLVQFLDKYMPRQISKASTVKTSSNETRTFDELLDVVRLHWFRNSRFRAIWFSKAPGSGRDESERDFYLVSYLYENVTQDKQLLQQLFESSEFFKTKDSHHVWKWTSNEHRYFNYLYDLMQKRH